MLDFGFVILIVESVKIHGKKTARKRDMVRFRLQDDHSTGYDLSRSGPK